MMKPLDQSAEFVKDCYHNQDASCLMIRSFSLPIIALSTAVFIAGCSTLGVYRIDVPQGTPITQSQAANIQVGMSQDQVLFLLGSPALRDAMAPNRWDYLYDFDPGTDARRAGRPAVGNANWHFIVYFDDAGRVIATEGAQTLPEQRKL